jgi:hypothetical protein
VAVRVVPGGLFLFAKRKTRRQPVQVPPVSVLGRNIKRHGLRRLDQVPQLCSKVANDNGGVLCLRFGHIPGFGHVCKHTRKRFNLPRGVCHPGKVHSLIHGVFLPQHFKIDFAAL